MRLSIRLRLFCVTLALLSCTASENATAPFAGSARVQITVRAENTPAPGVVVELGAFTATTDGQGLATFPSVPAGEYSLRVTAFPPSMRFAPMERPLTIARATVTGVIVGEFVRTSSVSGSIVGPAGPLAGIVVTLTGDGSPAQVTGSGGEFLFPALRAGVYTLSVSGWDPSQLSVAEPSRSLTVDVGDAIQADFVALGQTGTIRVTVTLRGDPAPAQRVRVSGEVEAFADTDAAGIARFSPVPVGPYTVQLVDPPNNVILVPISAEVQVQVGQTSDVNLGMSLDPPTTGTMSGRVTAEGTGIGGVTVTATRSEVRVAKTDDEGRYKLADVAAGGWTVEISGFDPTLYQFSGTAVNRTVAAAQVTIADFSAALLGGSLAIVPADLGTTVPGEAFAAGVMAVGGDGNYTWSVADGELPDGLRLEAGGVIRGAATTPGDRKFTLSVRSGGETATEEFLIRVAVEYGGARYVTVLSSSEGSATLRAGGREHRIQIVDEEGRPVAGARIGWGRSIPGTKALVVEGPDDAYYPTVIFDFPRNLSDPRPPFSAADIPPVVGGAQTIPIRTLASMAAAPGNLVEGLLPSQSSYYQLYQQSGRCLTVDVMANRMTGDAGRRFEEAAMGELLLWDSPTDFYHYSTERGFTDRTPAEVAEDLIRISEARLGMMGLTGDSEVRGHETFVTFAWYDPDHPFSFEAISVVGMDPTDPICRGLVPTNRGIVNQLFEDIYVDSIITGAFLYGPDLRPAVGVPVTYRTDDGLIRAEGDPGPGVTELTLITGADGQARIVWEFADRYEVQSVETEVDWAVDEAVFREEWSITANYIPEPPVGRVILDPSVLSLAPGEEVEISSEIFSTSNKIVPYELLWTSSNEAVVQVDQSGRVTVVGPGLVEVIATSRGVSGRTVISSSAGGTDWGHTCSGGFPGPGEPNDCPAETISITDADQGMYDTNYSTPVTGTLESEADRDYYRLEWPHASNVCIWLEAGSGELHWRMFDAEGAFLQSEGSVRFDGRYCEDNIPGGTWVLELRDNPGDGTAPSYTIRGRAIEKAPISGLIDTSGDNLGDARPVADGDQFWESMYPAGDEDWYAISSDQPYNACLLLTDPVLSKLVRSEVYDADGVRISGSSGSSCFNNESGGTWYVKVAPRHYADTIVGGYRVDVAVRPLLPAGGR